MTALDVILRAIEIIERGAPPYAWSDHGECCAFCAIATAKSELDEEGGVPFPERPLEIYESDLPLIGARNALLDVILRAIEIIERGAPPYAWSDHGECCAFCAIATAKSELDEEGGVPFPERPLEICESDLPLIEARNALARYSARPTIAIAEYSMLGHPDDPEPSRTNTLVILRNIAAQEAL